MTTRKTVSRLLPREPTEAMLKAALSPETQSYRVVGNVWRAMWEAAPSAPAEELNWLDINRLAERVRWLAGKNAAGQASPSVAPSDSESGSAVGPASAAPELRCPKCGANRYAEPCRMHNPMDCPLIGTAQSAPSKEAGTPSTDAMLALVQQHADDMDVRKMVPVEHARDLERKLIAARHQSGGRDEEAIRLAKERITHCITWHAADTHPCPFGACIMARALLAMVGEK